MSKKVVTNLVVDLTEEQEERLRNLTIENNKIWRKKRLPEVSMEELLGVLIGVHILKSADLDEVISKDERLIEQIKTKNNACIH